MDLYRHPAAFAACLAHLDHRLDPDHQHRRFLLGHWFVDYADAVVERPRAAQHE